MNENTTTIEPKLIYVAPQVKFNLPKQTKRPQKVNCSGTNNNLNKINQIPHKKAKTYNHKAKTRDNMIIHETYHEVYKGDLTSFW